MSGKLTYLDLFAGAGGLSEGFIREGFEPLAHVESDSENALPCSHTINAHLAIDGYYYAHFDNKPKRTLTPKQAAELATFPINYCFENAEGIPGSHPVLRLTGNAFPVLMMAGSYIKVNKVL